MLTIFSKIEEKFDNSEIGRTLSGKDLPKRNGGSSADWKG
jgi:hypothetical protein